VWLRQLPLDQVGFFSHELPNIADANRWRVIGSGNFLTTGGNEMKKSRVLLSGFSALFFVCGVGVVQAEDALKANLRPCVKDGTTFGEIGSCGKVWKLGSGEAKLEAYGKLKVEVKCLVLNDESTGESNGTPDGVTDVVATVICGGKITGAAERVPLSNPKGEAKVEAKLAIPANCEKPVVLLREIWEGKVGGWLASTGF
jgi:hypothetical protein